MNDTFLPYRERGLNGIDWIVALFAASLAFAVYFVTLAPTVYGEDSGELIAAAYTLGIPHPPGYPLWCLVANAFIQLLPFGNVAWRVNCLSAVFGAATVFVASLIISLLTRRRLAALTGALALAFSFEFWEQSVIAEVYTLSAFLLALCLYFLFVWRETRHNRWLYASAIVFGLALANHHVAVLLAPILAGYAISISGLRWGAWKMHVIAILLALAGLGLYLYLPVRSLADPPMDWGNPENWENLRDVLSRAQYQFLVFDGPRSWPRFGRQTLTFFSIYLDQFTPALGLLAPFGIIVLWRTQRGASLMLLLAFVSVAIGSILVPNFDLDRKSIWLNTTFWIPAYLIAAIFIGAILGEIAAFPMRRVVRGLSAILLTAAAGAAPLLAHFDRNNKSDDHFASDYARNILGTLAPGAVYFGDSDLALFPVLYYQIVENARPDVMVANPYGYPPSQVFAKIPESVRSGFAKRPTEADEQIIFEWLIMNSGRPVYSTVKRPWPNVANDGLLYRYAPPGTLIAPDDPWQHYLWHTLDPGDVKGDWSAEIVLYEAYFAQSRSLLDQGRTYEAINALDQAASLANQNKDGLNNLGATAAHYGLLDEAARYLKGAIELDAAFVPALKNLARVLIELNQPAQALTLLERARALAPGDPQIEQIRSACIAAMEKQHTPSREQAQRTGAAASDPP